MSIFQCLWFCLIFVLIAGYFVLDGFDLGAGVLYPLIAKTEGEKAVVRRSVGPVWDGNEVWLLTAGGALFAAFPMAYATTFSGFYLAIMLVLFGLIVRAILSSARTTPNGARRGTRASSSARCCRRCCSAWRSATSTPASRWMPTATTPASPCWAS